MSKEQSGDYFFFPYLDCIVFTARRVFKNADDKIVLPGKIGHVFRGKLKANSHDVLEFEPRHCDLSFEDLKKVKDKTCVVAFNDGFWRDSLKEPVRIQCVSFKYVGNRLSKETIQEWDFKLSKTHFHYCSAWLVTILEEPKPTALGPEHRFKVRIDEIFVENQRNKVLDAGIKIPHSNWLQMHFKIGETVECRLSDEWSGELPASPVTGKRAVWFFNIANNKKDIDLYGVASPFPKQKFDESDLAKLRAVIKLQSARLSALQCNAQSSMERFWTEARLRRFCRPENEYTQVKFGSAALKAGFNGEFFLSGSLFPNRPDLGKITWYATLRNGEPDYYQLDIWKDKSYWRIGSHFPDLLRVDDKVLFDNLDRIIAE